METVLLPYQKYEQRTCFSEVRLALSILLK